MQGGAGPLGRKMRIDREHLRCRIPLETEHAAPRCVVDQLGTGLGKVSEGSADVVDLVRDVVHSGASLREETAHRGVRLERSQQLEPAVAHPDRRRLDALLLDARSVLEPSPEQALIGVERAVEILDRETDMVHGAGRVHVAIVCERLETGCALPLLLS